ncbi:MAG: cyclic nucleotide-binding domain-containing protein [Bacteroidia bacterium]|nr:cyclic nucleotide-binding domain-containing protein [Bacteroidia bacterium]
MALLFQEIEFDTGQTVIQKNEPSTSVYIILNGTVRIHDGGHVFGLLDEGAIFGEYSLLDTRPRSASVTTITKTRLLKLDNSDLSKDKATRAAVIHGIVKVLTDRLRSHNELEEKLTEAYHRIRLQKLQIEQEKQVVEKKNEEIMGINAELTIQRDEIEKQRNEIKEEKEEIVQQNEEIRQQNEEIRAQQDELIKQRDILEEKLRIIEQQNRKILQLNRKIKAQRDKLQKQQDEIRNILRS